MALGEQSCPSQVPFASSRPIPWAGTKPNLVGKPTVTPLDNEVPCANFHHCPSSLEARQEARARESCFRGVGNLTVSPAHILKGVTD